MLETIFKGVFDTSSQSTISPGNFMLCVGAAIVAGIIITCAYMFKRECTKGFAAALAVIPATVCVIIMLVNGNIGAGVAVAGAFSLVRFRSAAGSAGKIGAIFISMGAGLACGMGYIGYALLFTVILGALTMIYNVLPFSKKKDGAERILRIAVPESLDYTGVFDDIFKKYTSEYSVISVKTVNLGSMMRLTYGIKERDPALEKEFIDALRCRNGNLEIGISLRETEADTEL